MKNMNNTEKETGKGLMDILRQGKSVFAGVAAAGLLYAALGIPAVNSEPTTINQANREDDTVTSLSKYESRSDAEVSKKSIGSLAEIAMKFGKISMSGVEDSVHYTLPLDNDRYPIIVFTDAAFRNKTVELSANGRPDEMDRLTVMINPFSSEALKDYGLDGKLERVAVDHVRMIIDSLVGEDKSSKILSEANQEFKDTYTHPLESTESFKKHQEGYATALMNVVHSQIRKLGYEKPKSIDGYKNLPPTPEANKTSYERTISEMEKLLGAVKSNPEFDSGFDSFKNNESYGELQVGDRNYTISKSPLSHHDEGLWIEWQAVDKKGRFIGPANTDTFGSLYLGKVKGKDMFFTKQVVDGTFVEFSGRGDEVPDEFKKVYNWLTGKKY
jgi:hypothetical protein